MSILQIICNDRPIVIRPVERTEAEIEAILRVYQQCEDFLALGPVPTASREMVLADLELSIQEGCVYHGIYAADTGEMLGIVDFSVSGFEGDPTLAFLFLLMISAPHRGHGLGAAVVEAVEGEIRRAGLARAIDSGVQVNNPAAISFWQRMGYRIVSGPTLMPDGTTCYQLWKDL